MTLTDDLVKETEETSARLDELIVKRDAQIESLYVVEGKSLLEIGKQMNLHPTWVGRILKARGVERRGKGRKRKASA